MFHELEGEEERVPLAATPDQDQATNLATQAPAQSAGNCLTQATGRNLHL